MEILDTIPVYESNAPVIIVSFCVMLASIILLIVGVDKDWHGSIIGIFAALSVAGFVFLFITGTKITFKQYDHDEFIVRIEEDYPISKLYEKYEIVSKYDYANIYTVKEKTKNETNE